MPSFELGMSSGVGSLLCSTPALIVVAPVKDLLPGMISVPLLEPGMTACAAFWRSGGGMRWLMLFEPGIMTGLACLCVNQTQPMSSEIEDRMALVRRKDLMC
jgi:hypothetical protein